MLRTLTIALASGLTIASVCLMTAPLVAQAPPGAPETPASRSSVLHARVVDRDGKPAPGVRVVASGLESGDLELKTDAGGRVEVPLSERDDRSSVRLLALPDAKALGWTPPISSRPIESPTGRADDPLTINLLPLSREVEGQALDLDGKPVAGLHVRVQGFNHPRYGFALLPESGAARAGERFGAITDDQGRYHLRVPEGSGASLMVRDRDHVSPWFGIQAGDDAIKPVTVYPAGRIAGRVTDRQTGRPVAGARLGAQGLDHDEKILGGGWGEATTDARGRFEIVGLAPGVYNVLLTRDPQGRRFTAPAFEAVRVRAGQESKADLERAEGRRLAGLVVDAESMKPQPGVMIGYYGTARPRSGAAVMNTRTDAEGRFALFVPPGPAFIYVMDMNRGGRLDSRSLEVPERGEPAPYRLVIPRPVPQPGAPKAVPAAKGEVVAIKAAPVAKQAVAAKAVAKMEIKAVPVPAEVDRKQRDLGRPLTGQVSDPKGAPIPGARVTFNRERLIQGTTDREGIFELEGLPRGDLDLFVSKEGFENRQVPVPADREAITIELARLPGTTRAAPPAPGEVPEGLHFADLQPLGNDPLDRGPGDFGNDLLRLPRGLQKLAGRWFRVEDLMIHLQGQNQLDFPKQVAGIKVDSRFKSLHVLHAVQQAEKPGTVVGRYVLHYGDGTRSELPIAYGDDLVNWWSFAPGDAEPGRARVAWTGSNATIDMNPGISIRLFAATYRNPNPEKEVKTIDFVSDVAACDPFVLALTLDPD